MKRNTLCADIIVAQSIGQLGNRLLHFAHLIALSVATGNKIYNPSFSLYSKYFIGTCGDSLCSYPCNDLTIKKSHLIQRFSYYFFRALAGSGIPKLLPACELVDIHWTAGDYNLGNPHFLTLLNSKRFIFLIGSYRHRYFEGLEAAASEIRSHFRLVPELENRIKLHMAPIRNSFDIVIGLHIRQGDNFTDPGRSDAFSSEEYALVANKIKNLFENKRVAFLVCSNAIQDSNFFSGLEIVPGPGNFVEDMYCLSLCDYIAGPRQSSFSQWASFMENKPLYSIKNPNATLTLGDFTPVTIIPR